MFNECGDWGEYARRTAGIFVRECGRYLSEIVAGTLLYVDTLTTTSSFAATRKETVEVSLLMM